MTNEESCEEIKRIAKLLYQDTMADGDDSNSSFLAFMALKEGVEMAYHLLRSVDEYRAAHGLQRGRVYQQ